MTSRKKPGVAFWATVVVVAALVAYPLSFGPACWISSRVQPSGEVVTMAYGPIARAWCHGPTAVRKAIDRYANLWSRLTVGRLHAIEGHYYIVFLPDR